MPLTFNDAVNSKPEGTGQRSAWRALQAWQYLIGRAHNRQMVRYGELSGLMDYANNQALTSVLNNIMQYCRQHALPPLTILVVNQEGVPGAGFTTVNSKTPYREQEEVFAYPWFKLVPPTPEDFQAAIAWSKQQAASEPSDR
ncbi:hypothetical protein [Deinococcus sp. QL22]|uniref:hypothetical protein n=1 Tax=Deinococcus sp. QL22 TaxID=2939437 RepID=UPI002016ABD3|nr:hypothetical protein [Deinococcus sp. QL22]UQN10674.1 hypothetical protein M1R55_30325 [Deinococcus sp. QL22]